MGADKLAPGPQNVIVKYRSSLIFSRKYCGVLEQQLQNPIIETSKDSGSEKTIKPAGATHSPTDMFKPKKSPAKPPKKKKRKIDLTDQLAEVCDDFQIVLFREKTKKKQVAE